MVGMEPTAEQQPKLGKREGRSPRDMAMSLLVLLIPVFLNGFAALHRRTRSLPGRAFILGGAYAALLLLAVPAAFAATGYGLYDILNGNRARRMTPPRS